jgi:hypothetical protein
MKENPNREKARGLARHISNMTDEQKAVWLARAPILTMDCKALSGKNHMLVAMQCEAATMVGGFRQWLAAGRAVRKGQAAIYIFAPCGNRKADSSAPSSADPGAPEGEAAESVRFLLVPVFDVSQTDEIAVTESVAA